MFFARCCCDDYNHCYREIGSHKQCPADFGGFDGIEIPSAIGGAENAFFEPFLYRNDPFAKTRSGQTSRKLSKKAFSFSAGFVELHCSHDSSMRSTAAMAAQPYIDYVDYTGMPSTSKTTNRLL